MEVAIGLFILAIVILLGVFGEIFFRKTGIPDVLWLILFGYLIVNLFYAVTPIVFNPIIPIFMAITIIIVLFEGGLHLSIGGVVKYFTTGLGLATITFLLSTGITALITMVIFWLGFLPNWNWWAGIILGAMVGGTSSIVVMPLVKIANLKDREKNILSVESAFTDALCVVVVMTLLTYLASSEHSVQLIVKSISSSFAIAILIGVIFGFIWLILLHKLKTYKNFQNYFYFLTLAFLFFIYISVEYMGGSAVVAIFTFGLILGNARILGKIFKTDLYKLDEDILLLNSQLAFLIKSFFFVLMGILLVIKPFYMLIAFLITLGLWAMRFITILIIPSTRHLEKGERNLFYFFAPKGLAAGVLAIIVSKSKVIPGGNAYIYIVFGIIIFSILLSTIGLFLYKYLWNKKVEVVKSDNVRKN